MKRLLRYFDAKLEINKENPSNPSHGYTLSHTLGNVNRSHGIHIRGQETSLINFLSSNSNRSPCQMLFKDRPHRNLSVVTYRPHLEITLTVRYNFHIIYLAGAVEVQAGRLDWWSRNLCFFYYFLYLVACLVGLHWVAVPVCMW